MQLTIEIPDKYLIQRSPEEFSRLLKLNTAIDLYKKGQVSAASAAELVGNIDRFEFLYECKKRGVEPQTYESLEELEAEAFMLDKDLS